MKIHTILYVLAFAAPALAAPKRKRVFKIYTPEEVRRLETYDDRMLKKTKEPIPSPGSMSMSMPTGYPTKSPKTEWPTASPKDAKKETAAPSAEETAAATTAPVAATTTAPVAATTTAPVAATTTTPAPISAVVATLNPTVLVAAVTATLNPTVLVAAVTATLNPTPAPVEAILITNAPIVSSTTITSSPIATVPENESRDEETSSPIAAADTFPTYSPNEAPITLAPATYAPSPKTPITAIVAPDAPTSGAMTLGTAMAAAVVACAMIFV